MALELRNSVSALGENAYIEDVPLPALQERLVHMILAVSVFGGGAALSANGRRVPRA